MNAPVLWTVFAIGYISGASLGVAVSIMTAKSPGVFALVGGGVIGTLLPLAIYSIHELGQREWLPAPASKPVRQFANETLEIRLTKDDLSASSWGRFQITPGELKIFADRVASDTGFRRRLTFARYLHHPLKRRAFEDFLEDLVEYGWAYRDSNGSVYLNRVGVAGMEYYSKEYPPTTHSRLGMPALLVD